VIMTYASICAATIAVARRFLQGQPRAQSYRRVLEHASSR
jgi:hypothetical protein